jgi:hypothetical protein
MAISSLFAAVKLRIAMLSMGERREESFDA